MLPITLISLGQCPSLATRNLRRYCLAHPDVQPHVSFDLIDRDIRAFARSRIKSTHRQSFVTDADEVLSRLLERRPAIVGFSCYLWSTEASIRLAGQIKSLLPETQIVLGGPDVGPRADTLLRQHPAIDVIINGDGEEPFLQIVRGHLAGTPADFAVVPQAVFRGADGGIARGATERPADLSRLTGVCDPLPTVDEIRRWSSPYVPYETMRGCPYPCSFCMYGKTPANKKDVSVVVAELREMLGRGLPVELIDPTFTTYEKRAKEILRGLARPADGGTLWFEAYPDSIDDEMVDLMVGAHVTGVEMGFQTLSAAGLDAVDRPQRQDRFERAVRLLSAAGIHFWVDVIYGLPLTTRDDFVAGMDYLFSIGVRSIDAYRLLGLPGSPMMDDPAAHGLIFSATPPYELLASDTFTIDEIRYCERFAAMYDFLESKMDHKLLAQFVQMAGRLSAVVGPAIDAVDLQQGDEAEFNRVMASIIQAQ